MAAGIMLGRVGRRTAVITIDAPPRNQLGDEETTALNRALDEIEQDLELRCVVLTGVGTSWCAGANLREEKSDLEDGLQEYVEDPTGFGTAIRRIDQLRVPVIGAINGHAVGGGMELALACDLRIGSDDARFMCAGVNVGLILSWYRLPRTIGIGPAKHMLLTGGMFGAEWALRNGLMTELVRPEDLMTTALEAAERIATRAPLSVERTKSATAQAFDLDFDEAMKLQSSLFIEMAQTADHKEAVAAFLDKRQANYIRG